MAEDKTEQTGTVVTNLNIASAVTSKFLDYSEFVILDRAISRITDGLKPVQRRVLFTLLNLGLKHNAQYKKCARAVGDCMGHYHAAGDTSIYGALINMAQPWRKRYPLIDINGNNGSVDGDPPAAMRYTECRLTKIGESMMNDINKNTVDFVLNYDESETEPSILPTLFPNVLCNGITGTAVGIATSMAPHYAGDVYKAIDYIIESMLNKQTPDINQVIRIIKAPDFPTGGIIINPEDMGNIYKTGKGRVVIRSVCSINSKNNTIIVTEIPYMVNKAKLVSDIGRACLSDSATIDGVKDINDESNKDGIKIVIKLKKDANPNTVLNNLYKKTDLQSSFSVNNTAIVNNRPVENLTLSHILSSFIRHVGEVVKRKAQFELNEYMKRKHLVDGYLLAIDHIDKIIKGIRTASNQEEKLSNVMAHGVDEIQAKAIIAMSLGSISAMDKDKFIAENEKLKENIAINTEIVNNNITLLKTCRKVLSDFASSDVFKKDERRTKINYNTDATISDRELIEDEDIVITYSHNGMVKAVKVSEYNTQKRNGKGTILRTREDDFIEKILTVSTKDNLLLFTQFGRCYTLPVYKIPIVSRNSVGKYIVNYIDLDEGDKIISVISVKEEQKESVLALITKLGNIKKIPIESTVTKYKSTKVIEFKDNDTLIGAYLLFDSKEMIVATKYGKGLRVNVADIRCIGSKNSPGIKLMKLTGKDEVIGAIPLTDESKSICLVTKTGLAKLTDNALTVHGRGTGGQRIITLIDNDELTYIGMVNPVETLFIATSGEMIIRIPVSDISVVGLTAKGVRAINMTDGSYVVSVSVAPEQEENMENDNNDGSGEQDKE